MQFGFAQCSVLLSKTAECATVVLEVKYHDFPNPCFSFSFWLAELFYDSLTFIFY